MKQIINELKAQPVIAWVTIFGTALAIFLIMVVVMLNQVNVVPMSPESNRDYLLYADYIYTESTDTLNRQAGSSSLGPKVVENVFGDLKTPEMITVYYNWTSTANVKGEGIPVMEADMRYTDANYFKIYDFKFLAGAPYNEADVNSHLRKAIITEDMARTLFNSVDEAVGKDVNINERTFTIVGVVDNVSPVTKYAYSQIWAPLPEEEVDDWGARFGTGSYAVAMLAKNKKDIQAIKDEVNSNLAKYNAAQAGEMLKSHLNDGPFTSEEKAYGARSQDDINTAKRRQYMLYLILLLIPAINLSTMTRSRLASRTGEIGVRRAFGATRMSIINSIITENMIITLIGGAIGLILSWIFGGLFFNSIYSAGLFAKYKVEYSAGAGALFAWSTFAYVLIFCFILNLLSSGLPAFRASRIKVVDAINAKK